MLLRRLQLTPLSLAIPLLLGGAPARQSGRALMTGYVNFEDVSYNDLAKGATHAKVELRGTSQYNNGSHYTVETDNRGSYTFPSTSLGEFALTISAPGYTTYQIALYFPSDFETRLATMLKKKATGGEHTPAHRK